MRSVILLSVFLSAMSFISQGQTGVVKGKISDATDGGLLPGAYVYLKENFTGGATDMDGEFVIDGVEPGTYTLVCSFVSYEQREIPQVVVMADQETVLDVTLGVQVNMMQGAEVVAKEDRSSVYLVDRLKLKSPVVMDGSSAATMRQNGDKSIAEAAKRVSGVSVEGGKYVYVRGLSDRYSKTLLNGAEIPGLDPNRNSVQLDLLPTNLIQNMMISKTFSPDMPADFTGGLVNIETKDFPEEFEQSFSFSSAYNSLATFNSNFFSYKGGKLDWLGMDDGTRALPDAVLNSDVASVGAGSNDLLSRQTQSFSKIWEPTRAAALPNLALAYSVGNSIHFPNSNRILGFNASLTYNRKNQYYEGGVTNRYLLTGNYDESNMLNVQSAMSDRASEQNVLWGALLNSSLQLNKNNKIGLIFIHNQSGISSTRYQMGRVPSIDPDNIKEQLSLRYLERRMSVVQAKGEHQMKDGMMVDWIVSTAASGQDTPDMRTLDNDFQRNSSGDLVYNINEAAYLAPNRYFREMSETNLDAKINFTVPIKLGYDTAGTVLKFGAARVIKHRNFSERRFEFGHVNAAFNGNISEYFSDENMQVGSDSFVFVEDLTDTRNTYKADAEVKAAYAMLDFMPWKHVRIVSGARVEKAFSQATSTKYFDLTDELERSKYRGTLDNLDVLPSLNLSYSVKDQSKFWAAYTKTVARPSFRELAPFASFDFETRYTKIGNPNLKRTLIDNLDLRYEVYPGMGELFSISAFYKSFVNPIELVINPLAANVELSWQNQDKAMVAGAEFEVKKSLEFMGENFSKWSSNLNVTLVHSRSLIAKNELDNIRSQDPNHPDYREMFGQSPYIVNAGLNYDNMEEEGGWSANMTYNVSGPKLVLIVGGGTPNVYGKPKNELNITLSKRISASSLLRIRCKNILGASSNWVYQFKGTEYIFQSNPLGRVCSVSYTLKF